MPAEWDRWRTPEGKANRVLDFKCRSRARARLEKMFPEVYAELLREEREALGYKPNLSPGRRRKVANVR